MAYEVELHSAGPTITIEAWSYEGAHRIARQALKRDGAYSHAVVRTYNFYEGTQSTEVVN